MKSNAKKGSGLRSLYPHSAQPVFTLPRVFEPTVIRVDDARLWMPAGTVPIQQPPPGAWFNLARTDPQDSRVVRSIAGRWGVLTWQGMDEESEPLAVWRALIDELGRLAAAWDDTGELAAPEKRQQTALLAHEVQHRVLTEHLRRGGTFASFGAGGWGMVTACMDHWWRLSTLASVYAETTFRRCRWCNAWFAMQGRRGDAGFCSERHRNYLHQGVVAASAYNSRRSRILGEPPLPPTWAELV